MEVAQPELQLPQRGIRERDRKDEDFDVSALFRSVSVPKEMSDSNLDGLEGDGVGLLRKANSVQAQVRMMEFDTDKEADVEDAWLDAEYVEAMRQAGILNPSVTGWRIGYKDHCDDYSSDEEVLVPPPNLAGLCFMEVKDESSKDHQAAILNLVAPALKEYKRREGVDYEFVKLQGLCLTSPPESEPDPDCHGQHMNFFAKLKGSRDDSSPEYFFASLSTQAVHCCKLIYDPAISPIQHCEHTKCFECDLWSWRKEK